MPHPALTQLRALRYFDAIPALDPNCSTGCYWKIP
jgi:hypothetical protein